MDQTSFLLPQSNQQQMTPDQRRQAIAQHFQQQIMAQPAQNVAAGAGQLATGIGMGLQNQGSAYPAAPAGAQPGMLTQLGNLFSFGHNGGLY